jgi:hypothetical protein
MARHPALWSDVTRDLDTAERACRLAAERAVSLAERGDQMPDDVRFDRELAIGKLLHDCYGALEAVLERLVDAIDEERPKGGDYHTRLVQRAAADIGGLRPAMIGAATAKDLQELRGFRHVMRHVYGDFDYERAAPNVGIAQRTVKNFRAEITEFARRIDILDDEPAAP